MPPRWCPVAAGVSGVHGGGKNWQSRRQSDDKSKRRRAHGSPADHAPASVATSFQLGSRAVMSLANVQTSVTLVTLSALPSITLPLRSRVDDTSCETKR